MNIGKQGSFLVYGGTLVLIGFLVTPATMETVRRASGQSPDWKQNVRTISAKNVKELMSSGKKVVFVDVREVAEYEEFHMPGAINAPVRNIANMDIKELQDADVVVPYCLKDFRGCEGAKALQSRGLDNVALIEGFGIKTWKKEKLPVAGKTTGMSDAQALEKLLSTPGAAK